MTEPVYQAPKSVQQLIPVYRIAENGIFEMERKKGNHLFDRAYLFTDVNFATKDPEEQEEFTEELRGLLNMMNVSYKMIIANQNRNMEALERSIFIRKRGDPVLDQFVEELNQLIQARIREGKSGIEQLRYFVVSCEKQNYENAKAYFDTLEANVKNAFSSMGSVLLPLQAEERLRALHAVYQLGKEETFDFHWEEAVKRGRNWKNDICNLAIKEHKDYLELDDRVCSTLFIKKYPNDLPQNFLTELTSIPYHTITTMDVIPIPQDIAYGMLENIYMGVERSIEKQQEFRNKRNAFSSDVSYTKRKEKEEIEELLDGFREYDERMFYCGITSLIIAKDKEELERCRQTIQELGNSRSVCIEPHSYNQLEAFHTTLPVAGRQVNTMRVLFTEAMTSLVPFHVQEVLDQNGISYGINQISKNPVIADRKKLKNGNGFVFGPPGVGKSLFVKGEMMQVYLKTTDRIACIDPQNEYFDFARTLHGQVIELSAGTTQFINPFDTPKRAEIDNLNTFIASKSEFMYGVCQRAFQGVRLNGRHIACIGRAVQSMYQKHFSRAEEGRRTSPTMRDCYEELKQLADEPDFRLHKREIQDLVVSLETFITGALNIFSNQNNVELNNRVVVFGIADLEESLRPIAMLVMMEAIKNKIEYNKARGHATWLYIDENHVITQSEYGVKEEEKLWRVVRKKGGICTGITQSIADNLQNPSTRNMISNSEFTMLLDQSKLDRNEVQDVLEISDRQLNYVTNAPVGTGLIRLGSNIIALDASIPKHSNLYALFNTNFHEKVENGEIVVLPEEKGENGDGREACR